MIGLIRWDSETIHQMRQLIDVVTVDFYLPFTPSHSHFVAKGWKIVRRARWKNEEMRMAKRNA